MAKTLGSLERQFCDIQGRLFELTLTKGLDSADFIAKFMNSKTCEYLDLPYDRLQWAGEEYVLVNLLEEATVAVGGEQYDRQVLFWAGYVYRYWSLREETPSREIYQLADAQRMKQCYLGFHTLDVPMAIGDLQEIARQEQQA
ncbi:MAG: hypothetical protein LBT22_03135 [Peptococcaceae bacterium]|nr:hypothetical protein [Peptococcaceae bacterium]